jgi:uncharacterized radical SAM superfamily Fe-S cluster-containing enzyme
VLKKHRERVEIYLQYDGESKESSAYHRGADIRRFKERALERLSEAGVFTTAELVHWMSGLGFQMTGLRVYPYRHAAG